jgi:hypothetical protein
MALAPTINDFISQIRFRVRKREEAFRQKVNGYFGDAGVSGQTGLLVRRTIDTLNADFDDAIDELIAYLVRAERKSSLDRQELYQAVAQELMQSAIAFKAAVDIERLTKFTKVGRVREIVQEAFTRLDEQLGVRLREYLVGLREDAAPDVDSQPPSLIVLRDRFFDAMLRNLADHADNVFVPSDVAREYGVPLNSGQLRLIMRELELEELVEPVVAPKSDSPRPNQESEQFVLTWSGVEAAQKLAGKSQSASRAAPALLAPASNRYVSLDDNARSAVVTELAELKDAIRGDNEADEEARLIALSEIAAFEQTIVQPRVSAELIERFISATLAWLTDAFSKAAVGEIAKRIIATLMRAMT